MEATLFAKAETRRRARTIRGELGPFATSALMFDKGRDRPVEIARITPRAIFYRLKGHGEEHCLPHATAALKALSLVADFDAGPRSGRIKRGGGQ